MQLKGAHFFGAQPFGRTAEILGKLLDGIKVATNGVGVVMTALELVDGLIANDKFCFSRCRRIRLARKFSACAKRTRPSAVVAVSREKISPREEKHAAPVESQPAVDGARGRNSSNLLVDRARAVCGSPRKQRGEPILIKRG